MRAVSIVGLAVVLAGSVAGCGGDDRRAYVTSVTKVQQRNQSDAGLLGGDLASATSPTAIGEQLRRLSGLVAANAATLAKITPPGSVDDEHARYVALLRRFSVDLSRLGSEAAQASPTGLPGVTQRAAMLSAEVAASESQLVTAINATLHR